ncbi:MAG: hypothetical protein HGGPFJEG_00213 [Ignavibacteria bacterium]|nr:hypothetical protein [Ignavibacteria bacterium]
MNEDLLNLCLLSAYLAKDDMTKAELTIIKLKNSSIKPRQIYEAILQAYLFCGFPVVIETLKIFKKHFGNLKINYHKYDLKKYSLSGVLNCKLIYKSNYKKLISNMSFVSPELKKWMIIEGYGKVLGRKALPLNVRELINISILTSRYFENQLYSHIKGCLNLNYNKKQIKDVLNFIKPAAGLHNHKKAINLLNKITKSV